MFRSDSDVPYWIIFEKIIFCFLFNFKITYFFNLIKSNIIFLTDSCKKFNLEAYRVLIEAKWINFDYFREKKQKKFF